MARVLRPLAQSQVNIEYSYAYSCSGTARIVLKVDDVDRAEGVLKEAGA